MKSAKLQSLKLRRSPLSSAEVQLNHLEKAVQPGFPRFSEKLNQHGLWPLKPTQIDTLQINVGKMCNQTCAHCHVDAGPDRKEIMTRETMQQCLDAIDRSKIGTIDLTGGAPEMNPHFRWFVEEIRHRGVHVIVRCNLTIILANERFHDLPQFFRDHQVEVISSLPHFTKGRTDRQRGDGIFERSIEALKMLNEVGYGKPDTNLKLNLVYNPVGTFLPGDQAALEREYKTRLMKEHQITFNNLYCITNMPISRFLEHLERTEQLESYLTTLLENFNPVAAKGVMCRNLVSVGWDGFLYDCDFNQMLEMKVALPKSHIRDFDRVALEGRSIQVNHHCYGCTAGSGSSCGGATSP